MQNYLLHINLVGLFFGFLPSNADLVLANKLVSYDLENQTIGWAEYNCEYTFSFNNCQTTCLDSWLNTLLIFIQQRILMWKKSFVFGQCYSQQNWNTWCVARLNTSLPLACSYYVDLCVQKRMELLFLIFFFLLPLWWGLFYFILFFLECGCMFDLKLVQFLWFRLCTGASRDSKYS